MTASPASRVYVIAEAGVNHNGDPDMARRLIDAAADAGADAVKFQTFRAEALVTEAAPKAAYQKVATDAGESQLAMLKRLELSPATHRHLAEHCRRRGIAFLSTPFDRESLRFLVEELGLKTLKIASGEITNGPLLLEAARSGRDIVLSTGMSTLGEVEDALGVLAFGFSESHAAPSRRAFRAAFDSAAGREALRERVVLLQCTSEYPAPASEANLRAMDAMHDAFGLGVGLSDHTAGIVVPIAAAALGAAIIEKHLTLDRSLPGPDHRASLEPGEFKDMVGAIRTVERALGDGVKAPMPSEMKNRDVVRRSLVALGPIGAGERFTEDNLGARRPGAGVSPMEYWEWLEGRADDDIPAGAPVTR